MKNGKVPVAAIVQARMGSTRLPGKSLKKVYRDYTLIELVLKRVWRAKLVDLVVLATSEARDCDPLADYAATLTDIEVYRGDETDVLKRFAGAIEQFRPETVVRVCADNPLIAPDEIDRLIIFFRKGGFDYSANNTPACGLADGLGCEITTGKILLEIDRRNPTHAEREHVTKYILAHPDAFRIGWLAAPMHLVLPHVKLDIDTPADLERMRCFCQGLPTTSAPYWSAVEITDHARTFF